MKVKCPTCGKTTEYTTSNKYRPFCCERCATLDLGAWADEKYRVPAVESSVNENSEEQDSSAELPPKDKLN